MARCKKEMSNHLQKQDSDNKLNNLTENFKPRRAWKDPLLVLKDQTCQHQLLYSAKLSI